MDVARRLALQDGMITRGQALDAGLSTSALRHRLRPGGPWQVALPGVYAAFTGRLSPDQRARAALLWSGPGAQLAGATVLQRRQLRSAPDDGRVHVLVPHDRRPRQTDLVAVRRTTRLSHARMIGGLPTCSLPRAVVDAARGMTSLLDVRAVVAEPVQRRLLRVEDLVTELRDGESAGSRLVRIALAEVADGVRSATEAELRDLLRRSPLLRSARWDVRLVDAAGRWLADVDCYLEEAGLVVESDSRTWHLSPEQWERTMARHGRLTAAGLRVLHVPPQRHRNDPTGVLAEVEAAYRVGVAAGGAPGVRRLLAA